MLKFEYQNAVPGNTAIIQTVENQIWWGRETDLLTRGHIILSSTVDAGNTPTTILRPGLVMGGPLSTGKITIWNPTALDGSENMYGILMQDQQMLANSVAADRFGPLVMVGGPAKASGLIIPGEAAAGIAGKSKEWALRAQMTQGGRFVFDDQLYPNMMGAWRVIKDLGADADDAYTILAADRDTLFTNESDTDALALTLPGIATVGVGFRCGVHAVADFAVTVTAAVADTIVAFNDNEADSIALSTAGDIVGGQLEFISLASGKWLCIPHVWADGVIVQTITIAT